MTLKNTTYLGVFLSGLSNFFKCFMILLQKYNAWYFYYFKEFSINFSIKKIIFISIKNIFLSLNVKTYFYLFVCFIYFKTIRFRKSCIYMYINIFRSERKINLSQTETEEGRYMSLKRIIEK